MQSKKLWILIGMIMGLILIFTASPSHIAAQEANASLIFTKDDCWFESPIPFIVPDLECGYVTVPERHEKPDGNTIRLPVAIIRATSESPNPDPLFLAQGGPGGDAFEVFPILVSQAAGQLNRDLVIFNQRGTRYAEPTLMCEESFEIAAEILNMPGPEADARSLTALEDCYERLTDAGVDLSAFNSLENAADVEAIRKALGYDAYNFYGVSYGTLLGLHLMRSQPPHLRSVILDGVVPPDLNFITQVAANTDRVFTNVIQTCVEDASCNDEYPNLEQRFFDLVNSLNESPVSISIKDPETGKRAQAELDGDGLVDVLFQAFYLPNSYAIFPKLVANLEQGDYTFIQGIWPLFAFDRTMSEGMYFSVICAEDADFEPSDANISAIRPYFAGNAQAEMQTYLDACEIWQVEQLPSSVDDSVSSDIPTLLFSGFYDPITPPQFAEIVADNLSKSYTFVEPTGSHGVAFDNSCTINVLSQFLDNPSQEPDTSCRDEITLAAFVDSDAISFPFVAEINQLSASMWRQLAVASLFLLGVLSSFLIFPLIGLISVLSKKDSLQTVTQSSRRLKWVGAILIMLFGILAVIFVAGSAFYTAQSLFNGLANIFAISSAAAPFFVIPLLLVPLALVVTYVAFSAWRNKIWSLALRIYYSFLALCAVGYVIVLAADGMMTVLL